MSQRGTARVETANRAQMSFQIFDLEAALPTEHLARTVVAFVDRLDLKPFYDKIEAREGTAGRAALDPPVLLSLWLYGTIDGVGSARAIDRLSESELAYQWIRGGMPLNHHTLSDFRTDNAVELDRLLAQSLADLVTEGLVRLDEVLIDGTKIRASAGAGSYKTKMSLAEMEVVAHAHIAELKAEIDTDCAAGLARRTAARARAARERLERIEAAQAMRVKVEAERAQRSNHSRGKGNDDAAIGGDGAAEKAKKAGKSEAKASTSDPEARVMRFADGSRRPGYNVQVAATPVDGFIVAIKATDRRNDTDLAAPMVAEVRRLIGQAPDRAVADQGYASAADIVALAALDPPVRLYAPVPPDRVDIKPEYLRRRQRRRELEPEAVQEWRARMQTEEATMTIKRRKRIELVNAHLKVGDFARQVVRGLAKVQAVCTLAALAHNLRTATRIRKAAAEAA
jgi:transposase